MSLISGFRSIVRAVYPSEHPYRFYDARADHFGPYYVTFRTSRAHRALSRQGTSKNHVRVEPQDVFEFGLDQHARWRRLGDERARERFLTQAQWAGTKQRKLGGVRGSYAIPHECARYGTRAGYRSAAAQGLGISLLLRAYEETQEIVYLERAVDASVPLTADVREGGVLWRSGPDVFFEGVGSSAPGHILNSWIFALWGLFELIHTAKIPRLDRLYEQSLATLEKYLPCYDTGSWTYESLLAAPSGFRRYASLREHMLHVAQLNVLLSMTKNELFAVVAERWRQYAFSLPSHLRIWSNALPGAITFDTLTVPGGARSIV
jgi:hypothetical protein